MSTRPWTGSWFVPGISRRSQVLVASIPVTAGAQAVRAHLVVAAAGVPPVACGVTNPPVVDDHDDLVFKAGG